MAITSGALLVLLVFCAAEGVYHQYSGEERAAIGEDSWRSPYYGGYYNRFYPGRDSRSEFSLSFDKRGILGRVSFDVDVMLPPEVRYRNITHIDVRFARESDLDGEVSVTRGGLGFDFATVHFESRAERGRIRAFVTLESR